MNNSDFLYFVLAMNPFLNIPLSLNWYNICTLGELRMFFLRRNKPTKPTNLYALIARIESFQRSNAGKLSPNEKQYLENIIHYNL